MHYFLLLLLFFFSLKADVPVVEDGLRLRNTASSSPLAAGLQQPPPQPEWVTNGQFPVWANQAGVADPLTQQLLWWQQTYAQQYWAQYMHHFSNGPHPQSTTASTPATLSSSVPQVPPQPVVAADAPPQPEPQRRPPLAPVGGVAQDEDEEGGLRGARDWLDWIYVASRLAILLGVMYYYSSLSRFVLVTLIVAGIYLYQKAIYQRRDNLANLQAINRNAREVNNNAGQGVEAPAPAGAEEPIAEEPEGMLNAERADAAAAVTPTAFNVAINLLIGFFTSLIPEVPAPEALN